MKLLLLIICTIFVNVCATINTQEWNNFKNQYQKIYGVNDILHQINYIINRIRIDTHNARYDRKLVSYRLGLNQYSDLNILQYFETLNGAPPLKFPNFIPTTTTTTTTTATPGGAEPPISSMPSDDPAFPTPKTKNYQTDGALTEIKNQGINCNSAWAFAALAVVEAGHFLKFAKLPESLSVQNLLDCAGSKESCSGKETPKLAFQYIEKNQNINSDRNYSYNGFPSKVCHYNPNELGTSLVSFEEIPENDDKILYEIVGNDGPVVIGFNPYSFEFQNYDGGIFQQPITFYDSEIRYYMAVVGYGHDDKLNMDYWLLKNSMGPMWGEGGFMRIERRPDKPIAKSAIYPII